MNALKIDFSLQIHELENDSWMWSFVFNFSNHKNKKSPLSSYGSNLGTRLGSSFGNEIGKIKNIFN